MVEKNIWPDKTSVNDFLNYLWKQKGELGKTWEELITDFRVRFPQIAHFSDSWITFKLKKEYKIKFMNFNSKPAKSN